MTPPFRLKPLPTSPPLRFRSEGALARYQARAAECPAWVRADSEEEVIAGLSTLTLPSEGWSREAGRIQRVLGTRAAMEADAERRAWTPLLDALATSGLWSEARRMEWKEEACLKPLPTPEQHLRRRGGEDLLEWIARQEESSSLEPLLHFRYRGVRHLLASYAGAWSEDLLHAVLEEGGHAQSLLLNCSFSREWVAQAVEWAYRRLESRPFSESERQSPPEHPAVEVLLTLSRTNQDAFSPERRERLLARLQCAPGEEEREGDESIRRAIPWVLLEEGAIESAEDLHRLQQGVPAGSILAERLVRHPLADSRLILQVLRNSPGMTTVEGLVSSEARWLRERKIRQRLQDSQSPYVLEHLLGVLKGEPFRESWLRLRALDLPAAVRLLERRREVASQALYREDLLPLLSSPRAGDRLLAISLLGGLEEREGGGRVASAPREVSRRR